MKIVSYIISGVIDNYRLDSRCYYIPNEKAILCERLCESKSIEWRTSEDYDEDLNYYITTDKERLKEAELIKKGETPKNDLLKFLNIKNIEIEDTKVISKIHSLIYNTKNLKILEQKVKEGFFDISKLITNLVLSEIHKP